MQCAKYNHKCRYSTKYNFAHNNAVMATSGQKGQPARLCSQSREMVESVRSFFEKEKKAGKSILRDRVLDRTAKACGISRATVGRIHNEAKRNEGKFESPKKRYSKPNTRINPDAFDQEAIRRSVHEFYLRKEYPTLDKILEVVRARGIFPGGRFLLWKLLRQMGFRHKKCNDKQYIYEQPRVIEQRHSYLRRMKRNRTEQRSTIYLDETWLNSHHARELLWVDTTSGMGGWKRPSGKGERLIILHAGSEEGWVKDADDVFRAKSNTGDYHNEMNILHFMDWFTNKLLPNIPPQSLIILDNAKYHNGVVEKIPTKSSTKKVMKEWLEKHNIPFTQSDLKADLHRKIVAANPKPKYLTDVEASKCGHEVLRLPIAHCELNPIELARAAVKEYVREKNKSLHLKKLSD